MKWRNQNCVTLGLMVLCLLSACAPAAPAAMVHLKFIVLTGVLDTLPVYVAEANGYFKANGLEVELVPVGSAPERDQIIAAGQADGMLNELLTTMLSDRDAIQVQSVRLARVATSEFPLFRIVAGPNTGIKTPQELKGASIGISNGTVIEYVAERLMTAEGLRGADLNFVSVPKIGDRLALLQNGQIKAAVLPDPVASVAIAAGGTVPLDDTRHPEFSQSVLSFRKIVLDQNPQAIRSFLKAVEQAVRDINTDSSKWDKLLEEKGLVPQALIGKYRPPRYPAAGVPSPSQFEDTLAWARAKGLLSKDLAYGDIVNASFLPQ